MYLRLFLLVACLFLQATSIASAGVIYESAAIGQTGFTRDEVWNQVVLAANIKETAYNGVRFYINQPAVITEIGGHFVGSTLPRQFTFFGAIVQLDDELDFPDSVDMSTPDVLGSTVIDFPDPSGDVYGSLNLLVSPGWHCVIFGSGYLGASGVGAALLNNQDIGNPDYIGYLKGFSWGNRLPGMRFVVRGTTIPESSCLALAGIGILFVFLLRIR